MGEADAVSPRDGARKHAKRGRQLRDIHPSSASLSPSTSSKEMNPGRGPPVRWWELHALPATAALLLALITYGVMQERIMTHPYGGEMFPSSLLLVFVNRALTVLVSGVALLASASNTPPSQSPPAYNYIGVSCANVLATTAQFEALKYALSHIRPPPRTNRTGPIRVDRGSSGSC
jgi:hypothetical protein